MKANLLAAITFATLSIESYSIYADEVTVFTLQSEQSANDERYNYDFAVFKLALEKTASNYGPYKFVPLNMRANVLRIESLIDDPNYPNLFYKNSISKEKIKALAYANFPVDLGIVGYRVGFTSKAIEKELRKVTTLKQLKKFTILQGPGWLDTNILKHNGFKVDVSYSYQGLFHMIAKNRGDIFMRGINEILSEWTNNNKIDGLVYDTNFALYYPLPRFFFTSKNNINAALRIEEGLKISYEDGSLQKLWTNHYKQSIEFVNLSKRRIFIIDNPFLEGINTDYKQYLFNPLK